MILFLGVNNVLIDSEAIRDDFVNFKIYRLNLLVTLEEISYMRAFIELEPV